MPDTEDDLPDNDAARGYKAAEALRLIRAFHRINEPEERARVIDFAERLASEDKSS